MDLDFFTTATCRPEILSQTYESFSKNLCGVDFKQSTLFINVDPVPCKDKRDEVIEVARNYFGKVVTRTPDSPGFCQAIKWGWSQPSTRLFFNLEDDWILTEKVKASLVIQLMQKDIAIVTLRAYCSIKDSRLCLSPGFVRTGWANKVAKALNPNYNPEQQLRGKSKENPEAGKNFDMKGIQYPVSRDRSLCRDIGREWLRGTNMCKNGNKIKFNKWKMRDSE